MADDTVENVSSSEEAIRFCLEHIWESLGLRARLFLREGGDLVLKEWAGEYGESFEGGLKAHPESIVWEVFRKGTPLNLTQEPCGECRPHSLAHPCSIKAVIPLKFRGSGLPVGVLVVDTGQPSKPVEERDFRSLQIIALLIAEMLERDYLERRVRASDEEKRAIRMEVNHICRNRFLVIGGFARKLVELLKDPDLRDRAGVILDEVEKVEEALDQWERARDLSPDTFVFPSDLSGGGGCSPTRELSELKSRIVRLHDTLTGLKRCSEFGELLQGIFQLRERLDMLEQRLLQTHLKCCVSPVLDISDEIILAVSRLSARRHGALLVLEQEDLLDERISGGVVVDAALSAPVLESIFYPGNPLHDGAVLIRSNRVYKAGCILPLASPNGRLESLGLGTRHRAALGISQCCDALVIVVSEERGWISLAYRDRLYPNFGLASLLGKLEEILKRKEEMDALPS